MGMRSLKKLWKKAKAYREADRLYEFSLRKIEQAKLPQDQKERLLRDAEIAYRKQYSKVTNECHTD